MKHLTLGSVCPPAVAGLLRCYNMKFCPFAQRALIILEAKNVKYDIVNINLKQKPEWFFEKSPLGKVPSIEVDGKIMSESLVICDYLDEVYPEPPLHSPDPWRKGQDRMFLEIFGKVTGGFYNVYFSRGDKDTLNKGLTNARAGLDSFETELAKRNTKLYGGDKPGMLDYMIWPWMERLPVVEKFCDQAVLTENCYPKLFSWREEMQKDSAVKATCISPEVHYKYLLTSLSGFPDYDMELAMPSHL
ncbi:pyrimidodiazepine synthase-like isoform X2 [Portunus trituberculatus]|uniref:pyrimidodiazepine synthase-like isoform X2 n=1 Tax=Portunus trituberculatus TaxID=210409 RepID=UPI001E1CB7B7|nr:pyrimidodiazepine synthase-like isoform X2 [Portunus trituberculatus]XP_045129965.1 pyrimidodiazepine synthase-like isoform X2 [Portunus trituberculatus]XP_045129966.1 pyrimidodiazepine synthase-like isoform X2 [Portunus trituberculatus]